MADGIPTKPPTFTTRNWGAMVRQSWGDSWHQPEIAYRMSNGRTFNDSGSQRGVYAYEMTVWDDGATVWDVVDGSPQTVWDLTP